MYAISIYHYRNMYSLVSYKMLPETIMSSMYSVWIIYNTNQMFQYNINKCKTDT